MTILLCGLDIVVEYGLYGVLAPGDAGVPPPPPPQLKNIFYIGKVTMERYPPTA